MALGTSRGENASGEHAKTSSETLYSAAGKTSVPDLSQLRDELLRAVEAGDWLRVAELAAQLAALLKP